MDIILHGKPYSSSFLSTSSLDGELVDNITKRFFDAMGNIKNEKGLIVEARFWKNQWYSVYTYSRFSGIRDASENTGRQSYISLSLVIPYAYFRLTSDVYSLLDQVYQKHILGNYISKEGKYLVSTFADTQNVFKNICKEINNGLDGSNIAEDFDSNFKTTSTETLHYNLLDCDSNAFINDLRKCGKIIVGEGNLFPAKCSNVVLMQKENQIKQLTATQTQLDGELQQAKEKLSNASNKSSKQINELNGQINSLQNRNNTLAAELSARNETLQQISALLPNAKLGQQTIINTGTTIHSEDARTCCKSTYSKWLRYVPVINCVFLLLFVAIILGKPTTDDGAKEKYQQTIDVLSNENKNYADSIINLNRRLTATNKELENAKQIIAISSSTSSGTGTSNEGKASTSTKDTIDALIQFEVNGLPAKIRKENDINTFDVRRGDTISISWNYTKNYNWAYGEGLNDNTGVSLKTNDTNQGGNYRFTITDKDNSFLLVYRTRQAGSATNAHKNNKFQIKIVE